MIPVGSKIAFQYEMLSKYKVKSNKELWLKNYMCVHELYGLRILLWVCSTYIDLEL